MVVGSATVEPCRAQRDTLLGQPLCTKQGCGLTGIAGRSPAARLTSGNPLLAVGLGGRSTWVSEPAARPAGCPGWNTQTQDVPWLNELHQPPRANASAVDVRMRGMGSGLARDDGGISVECVSRLCHDGDLSEAVQALEALVHTDCRIPKSLFYTVLKKCVVKGDLVLGSRVHDFTVRNGYQSDTVLGFHVLRMYASHGRLHDARNVFELVSKPDAFTWAAIISAHVKQGQDKQAVELYHRMQRSGVKPDGHVFVAALQACARAGDLGSGQQVHAHVLSTGLQPDLFVSNCLVDMYAKCGRLEDAQRVFDGLARKDVVTWNTMIGGFAQWGRGDEALSIYSAMQFEGIVAPDSVTFLCLLQACASVSTQALEKGKHLHAQLRERGYESHVIVANSLVSMYAKCGSLEDAKTVFDGLGRKDVVTWNAMIAGYSQQGMGHEALHLYRAMQEDGRSVPDSMIFVCLLQACASLGTAGLEKGKQLHEDIRERALEADVFVGSSLVNMYAKCGSLDDAQGVFDRLVRKNVVTWNALISGYSQHGMGQEALQLYSVMQRQGMSAPNSVTFVCLLHACASMGTQALEKGRSLHAQIREREVEGDGVVANSLVNMYSKCGSVEDARRVFDALVHKDVVTWSAMIAAYCQQGRVHDAFYLYSAMQEEGTVVPSAVTFVSLLQACASVGNPALQQGKLLHAHIRKQEHEADVYVASSLVNMYAKCGSLEDAQKVFDRLGEKTVGAWTAMIAGYSQKGMGQEALHVYRAMQQDGMPLPDSVTFGCLLQACANVAALHLGRQLHAQIVELGLEGDLCIASSLISMYGKCCSMGDAQKVFDELPERNVITWSALITGYSAQGESEVVLDLVYRMREDSIQPNGVTFLSVLTVCSHAGLVMKAWEFFGAMSRDYGFAPTADHYVCMVDVLGRAGQLDEALALVRSMPVPPSAAVWHTLLGACRKWGNVKVGLLAFNESVKLGGKEAATYVLMSNIYTAVQMWNHAEEMQARRKGIRAWKQPGQTWWTDTEGLVHSFLVGDERQDSFKVQHF